MGGFVIDEKEQKFMLSLFKKGVHVSRSVAATTALVLLSRTDDEVCKERGCYKYVGKKSFTETQSSKSITDYWQKLNTGERRERSRFTVSLSHNKYSREA